MPNSNRGNYDSSKHWHVDFYEDNTVIESIGFQRKDDGTWDVYFGDFKDDIEYAALVSEPSQTDDCFGVLLFNSPESNVLQKFHEWVRTVLLPIRKLNG